jgi:uncharacterized surface protein with fasciclin (FAS1) repeats
MITTGPRIVVLAALLAVPSLACGGDLSDGPATTVATPAETVPAPTSTAEPMTFDIVGTALKSVVFTQLAGMVLDAGLVETLRGDGPFTVFAPTNAAFQALPVDALHGVQDDPDLLAMVLTYHVVPGALTLADLEDGALTTVAGIDLQVTHDGDHVLINGLAIATGDVVATNGIIHVMNDVLLPPS